MVDVDPTWLAMSRYRRHRYKQCIENCGELLVQNPLDQMVWYIKTRALTADQYLDEAELEEEGVAELLLDDNAVNSMPRPGTSLSNPKTGGGTNQAVRPVSSSGRPMSGFSRPATNSGRPMSGQVSVDQAFRGDGSGTKRAATALGRELRLGTASMASIDGIFINVDKLDMRKYARRPALAMALADYLLHVEVNPRRALELCAEATERANFESWWWKSRLGKCYYKLGLYRDSEKQLRSSLKNMEMLGCYFDLCKVYLKLDVPNTALDLMMKAGTGFPNEPRIILGIAQIYDMLNDPVNASKAYKKVLGLDPSNVEAMACLAANYYYEDAPELGLRYYRRLLQIGVSTTELWNNIGLCCFDSSQYDMALSCFERALGMAEDSNMADVWFNIGQVAIRIGDLSLAYQAFKIAVSVDRNHAESYCNLGVLDLRKNDVDSAHAMFATAHTLAPWNFEPCFNAALLSFKRGNLEGAYGSVKKSLDLFPEHSDSKELKAQISNALFGMR